MSKKTNPFRRMLMPVLIMAFLAMLSGCSTGGLTDATSGTGGTGTGTGTGTGSGATQGTVALSLTKSSDGSPTTSVSVDSPATLTAIVKDSNGAAIVGKVVSFSTTIDLSFNPASGTSLTDANGVASITVQAGNTTGATTIKADITEASGNALSGNIGLSITPPNLSLSDLTINPAGALSAGGSAGVTISVLNGSGKPYTTSVAVSFTSNGVQVNRASITSQVFTVNGIASATYKDINYAINVSSVDTITATLSIGGTTLTKTGTITVNPASAGSISFVSAAPANIALKGTGGLGRSETSIVSFKVLDTNGNPIRKTVNFSASTVLGGLSLMPASADSDPVSGQVQTIVQAGTVSTPVRVSAAIAGSSPSISTTSDLLVISTGIPAQNSFSISASKLNIEGLNFDGETSDVTVRLADHFNNPVPDGTAVSFRSSGGSIQPSCTTTGGGCTVKFTSQEPRPTTVAGHTFAGRVAVLAYALGEESFVDLNGNGVYDAATVDSYSDMPEAFLDANFNGSRDAWEEFVDTNTNGSYDGPDGIFNGILRNAAITGPTTIHVRGSLRLILSGSGAVITINNGNPINLPPCQSGVAPGATAFTAVPVTYSVTIVDVNGNVMPADTAITFSSTNGTILSPLTFAVPNTSTTSPPGYAITLKSQVTQSGTGTVLDPYVCSTPQSGLLTVTVKTPKGVSTVSSVGVNN